MSGYNWAVANGLMSEEYLEVQRRMHAEKPNYAGSSGKYAKFVLAMAGQIEAETILDYGCGRGQLRSTLEGGGYKTFEYDPSVAGKEAPPARCDMVACMDVLEHVEPQCLDSVLAHIKSLAKKGVYLLVATREANKHLPDGRNAHLIVESPDWWLEKLLRYWRVIFAENCADGKALLFLGRTPDVGEKGVWGEALEAGMPSEL